MSVDESVGEGGLEGRLFHRRVHLVSHTHWDREWYHPAGRFRQRLVALVDELLDTPAPEGAFLLDGQTIVVEDYLAMRPERAAELAAHLRDGKLEAGPWFVLADELIPSGEALVRNLLAGRRTLRTLRAEAPPVLYCPDSFGHPAALPAIAAGFGFELIVLWRGFGGARWPASDLVRWQAPDHSSVLVYHLPPNGYEAGANLPTDPVAAASRWRAIAAATTPRNTSGIILLPNGADHHARQENLDAAVVAMRAASSPHEIVRSSLRTFANALLATARDTPPLAIRGELRDSYGYTWTLQGTFASRAAQKRRNARVERLLTRECEPFAALAARRGSFNARPLLNAAWRALLQCHPHDTLCGCSVDEVARAMDARLEDAESQAVGIRQDAVEHLIGHDAATAQSRRNDWRPTCVIANAAPRPRSGVAEVQLDTPLYRVAVGPGSQATPPTRLRRKPLSLGPTVPLQLLSRETVVLRTESPRHYPVAEMCERAFALGWVSQVTGYGTLSHPLGGAPATVAALPASVTASGLSLDNRIVRVSVTATGAVRLEDIESGRSIESVIAFEDVGDRGDLYTHSPAGAPERDAQFIGARLVHEGPLRGVVDARWRLSVPRGSSRSGRVKGRAGATRLDVTVTLALDAGARFLRIAVRGTNTAPDHRLRLVLQTGVTNSAVYADAAFGAVRREPIVVSSEEARSEQPPSTAPLHRYVSLYGSVTGATVYSDGLAEYEATDAGEVAITLVRAVGQLSRNDLPERPGHAGWPSDTPEAQSLGPFSATLAIMLHGPRDAAMIDVVEQTADDVLLPLRGTTVRAALHAPTPTAGIELIGRGLAFSAAKPGEDGTALVLRCVNLLDEPVNGEWRLGHPISSAQFARLDETITGPPVSVQDNLIRFTAPPRGIVTLVVH